MKSSRTLLFLTLMITTLVYSTLAEKSECFTKREAAERLVKQQEKNQSLNLAIVVPNCNDDGTYATLQCHHNSNFCQCWDKEGLPLTQPKKNLQKCSCMVDRAKTLKKIPPSQTDIPELVSCEVDGSYTAKQCNRDACWCVNSETGEKTTKPTKDKTSSLRC